MINYKTLSKLEESTREETSDSLFANPTVSILSSSLSSFGHLKESPFRGTSDYELYTLRILMTRVTPLLVREDSYTKGYSSSTNTPIHSSTPVEGW